MQPVYVSKNISAASSAGVASFTSAGAITLNTSDLGTARRIIVWGSTSVAATFTIYGSDETGTPLSETVVGSTTGAVVTTTQDFRIVSSVAISGTITATGGYIGTSTQGGTPWQVVDTTRNPIGLSFDVRPTSTSVVVSLEYSPDYPAYNPQNRNWPQSANQSNGPYPTISTACSSVTAVTIGSISTPIAAWRLTLTSSSSGSGTAIALVTQSG